MENNWNFNDEFNFLLSIIYTKKIKIIYTNSGKIFIISENMVLSWYELIFFNQNFF